MKRQRLTPEQSRILRRRNYLRRVIRIWCGVIKPSSRREVHRATARRAMRDLVDVVPWRSVDTKYGRRVFQYHMFVVSPPKAVPQVSQKRLAVSVDGGKRGT